MEAGGAISGGHPQDSGVCEGEGDKNDAWNCHGNWNVSRAGHMADRNSDRSGGGLFCDQKSGEGCPEGVWDRERGKIGWKRDGRQRIFWGTDPVRRACPEEFERVMEFYDRLTDEMEGAQYHPGWEKGVYPDPEFYPGVHGRGRAVRSGERRRDCRGHGDKPPGDGWL